MRVVALLSGGKDSLFNMYLATKENHQIVAIANLKPPKSSGSDELDSYMYQTVGHEAITFISKALELPLFRAEITGKTKNTDLNYKVIDHDDEVEQLYQLLKDIRDNEKIQFDAISVGAIASTYQKTRCENICQRLNIKMLAYLWEQNQDQLLQQMIDNQFDAILIKVACLGLDRKHIGLSIKEMQNYLRELNQKYDTNICGEGGEYESLVLDCPLYKKKLNIINSNIACHDDNPITPVYHMRELSIELLDK